MRERNIYQCTEECRNCTYEKKNPTGYDDDFDECTTDHCPQNHYQLGNIDRINGRHSEGYGWNPLGEFCNQCKHTSCEDCIKWSNRDKKLRNNIPPELKQPKKTTIKEPEPIVVEHKEQEKTEANSVVEQALKIMEEEKKIAESKIHDQAMLNTNNTFIDTDRIADATSMDDFDFDDFDEEKLKEIKTEKVIKEIIETGINETPNNEKTIEESEETDEIDFGMDITTNEETEDYADVSFDEDDIPAPDDYEEQDEESQNNNNDSEEDDSDDDNDDNDDDDDEEEDDDDDDDDDDDEDYDEDDEAEFALFEQTKKLKASILFAPDTKIAQYNVRNVGVYLTVTGDSKVTVKGRNDSDGFSYCDPNRFPRYIREGILNGELYKNDNIKITDNSKFIFVHYNDIDGEILKRGSMECKTDLTDVSEEKLRKLLKKAMDKFLQERED